MGSEVIVIFGFPAPTESGGAGSGCFLELWGIGIELTEGFLFIILPQL